MRGVGNCFPRGVSSWGFPLGTFKQGVSKQGVMTFAWRPGLQYDVSVTRGADNVLASDCRAQFGRPSTRRGCRICVTVRLTVRRRRETMYWQTNANTPLSVTPLLNVPYESPPPLFCPPPLWRSLEMALQRCNARRHSPGPLSGTE